jgi:hypothetical protein
VPLRITATPLGLAAPLVRVEVPANSGPGEIHASVVEVPFAGCWHVELAWGPNADAVDHTHLPGR